MASVAVYHPHRLRHFPLFPRALGISTNEITHFLLLHKPHSFEPLKVLQHGKAILQLNTTELDKTESYFVDAWKWHEASACPKAPIVVLGTSITGGRGADEPTGQEEQIAGTADLSSVYNVGQSWGHHFVDILNRHLMLHRLESVRNVSIFYKSGTFPSFFSMCTNSVLPPDTRIVLLEAPTWMITQAGIKEQLARIANAVRRVAPNAVIVFVEWPALEDVSESAMAPNLVAMDAAASELKIDTVRVYHALRAVASHCTHSDYDVPFSNLSKETPGRLKWLYRHFPCYHELYANRAKDMVHPNPWGHQLLGALVARHVARALVNASMASMSQAAANTPTVLHQVDTSSSTAPSDSHFELCYLSAPDLPLIAAASHGTWKLVDEGHQGVEKLGYLSTQKGDVLVLDILRDFPRNHTGNSCGLLTVTLSYLLSTSIPDQGAFNLTCDGCRCKELSVPLQDLFNPFPVVETNANAHYTFRGVNISITAQTRFVAYYSNTSTCTLSVSHVPSGWPLPNFQHTPLLQARSRIRIDGLFIEPMQQSSVLWYTHHQRHSKTAKFLRAVNSSGCRI
uniref:Uncharacterized protein n=1 Tax=Chrysotila carterae TaxID=13221 RepID=A0A7S4F9A4_CHRCT